MGRFIATIIKAQGAISTEEGQAKYRAYFLDVTLYKKWQAEVDAILTAEGYEACIVTE